MLFLVLQQPRARTGNVGSPDAGIGFPGPNASRTGRCSANRFPALVCRRVMPPEIHRVSGFSSGAALSSFQPLRIFEEAL